jgi:ribosomal protein S18 acetylase RimI-like enzyme
MDAAADDVVVRPFDRADTEAVLALWRDAFPEYGDPSAPHRDPLRAIEQKCATQPELFFVSTLQGRVVGTVMAGYDGHRGWLYSLGVDRHLRRAGVGRALVAHAEAALGALGCLKVNLQVLSDNADACRFYATLDYRVEELVSFGKRLYAA